MGWGGDIERLGFEADSMRGFSHGVLHSVLYSVVRTPNWPILTSTRSKRSQTQEVLARYPRILRCADPILVFFFHRCRVLQRFRNQPTLGFKYHVE